MRCFKIVRNTNGFWEIEVSDEDDFGSEFEMKNVTELRKVAQLLIEKADEIEKNKEETNEAG